MSIDLFIERKNGSDPQQIELTEWLDIAAVDADLRISDEPLRAKNPVSGEVISIAVGPGTSQLRVQGEWFPFLQWRRGALTCRYHERMEDADDPFRLKIVAVSQKLGAAIFLDVKDEALEW